METNTADLIESGLTSSEAKKIADILHDKNSPEDRWQAISKLIVKNKFSVHEHLYKTIYPDWNNIPSPAWFPDDKTIESANITQLMREKNFSTYKEFHEWSVKYVENFWQTMVEKLHIIFEQPYQAFVDISKGVESPEWFSQAKLNIVNSCFQASKTDIAIISQNEQGELTTTTYEELDKLSNRIANSLCKHLKKGDKVAIIMPMTRLAVAIYLGIIKAGCVCVGIPDSFSTEEIKTRLRIADVKAVFCQDVIIRDGKMLQLYERIVRADPAFVIVSPVEKNLAIQLRHHDLSWQNFLVENEKFIAVSCEPSDNINILFSSGTTGEPKAIPWTHTSPIKCGSDAFLHQNIQAGDRFCWPTNLGWMMGPWLIFACLLNKATIAIYEGTPNNENFGKFVEQAKVTILGVVPTIVRTWHVSGCMEKTNWNSIKLFTSTGERSNTEDMLYLMSLAHYRPVIEYCGGTEISGAYITSTVIQPSAPASFTTPALGLDFVILDDHGNRTTNGEVAIIPPSIGLSTKLLNKDHHEVYYAGMPKCAGRVLRRHGDQVEYFTNGFYRLLGRVDDTMKLGGIKISSAEIETTLNTLDPIFETAAIAVNPVNGGPSQLIIYAVLKKHEKVTVADLKSEMQKKIKELLNPLFKIHEVIIVDALPRTASNKIMRRTLRDEYQNH